MAVIVTFVELETNDVVIVKFALVWPAGTVTVGGTVAALVLLLDSGTAMPPVGAATLSVTVPVTVPTPPVVVLGLSDRD